LLTDDAAREDLKSRGVLSAPVTIIDGTEVIIGYYPKKLIPALGLDDAPIDLSGRTAWLADKYQRILAAAVRATRELSGDQLEKPVQWRPELLRDTLVHIVSFPELAYTSHTRGSMSSEDMRACRDSLVHLQKPDEIAAYAEQVSDNIVAFLNSGNTNGFDRVVPAHYGGEVTVLELLNIILSHSTHHLKQVYWYMDDQLGQPVKSPATEEDMEGIFTPAQLI
jgi:uncharacterized damage-inducible protein DinB